MGKKSIAVKKEIMKKKLGRNPTRYELFQECYCSSEGVPSSDAVRDAIEQMEELAAENPPDLNNSEVVYNPDDVFAKVMGKDNDGRVRMYGTGVASTDVCGEKPSRDAILRESTEYKEKYLREVEKSRALNEELTAYRRSPSNGQPVAENARVASPNGLCNSQSPPVAPLNNCRSALPTSQVPIRVGSFVVLKGLANINEVVATGIVNEIGNVRVNGMDLGPEICLVIVQVQVKNDARLLYPTGHFQTIIDVLGVPVAWSLSLIALDDEES